MDYFVLVAVLDIFFYSVSLHKKTLELTGVVVLANLFKHNTLITSLRVIYKYKNVSFCSYKLYREACQHKVTIYSQYFWIYFVVCRKKYSNILRQLEFLNKILKLFSLKFFYAFAHFKIFNQ